MINFDKFLASFITEMKKYQPITCYNLPGCIKKALDDQGLEYKDGEIVKAQCKISSETKEAGYDESEDERIRRELINYLKQRLNMAPSIPTAFDSWIDWLEKQSNEPKWCHHKVDLSDCSEEYRKAYYDGWNNCNMQHEQCNAEHKLKLKFKVGDWVVDEDDIYQIYNISLKKYYECLRTDGTVHTFDFEYIDSKCHLWTINDAKDGDVLATDSWLYIFKYTNNKAIIQFHCTCPINGRPYKWCFLPDNSYLDIYVGANIHPATTEQRDTLFAKMHEAGYTFDFEKKELKKIEPLTDFEKAFQGMCCDKNKQFAKECCKTLLELAKK